MEVFVKSFSTYRTIKQITAINSSLVLDSLNADTSSVTVKGTGIGHSDIGNWLIADGAVYRIVAVNPQEDRTILTLAFPNSIFSRSLELDEQPTGQTIGGFIADALSNHWIQADDPAYAVSYLVVSNSDTTPYVPPELDAAGCYSMTDYMELMRRSYRVTVRFSDSGGTLRCGIYKAADSHRQVSFEDGHSKLQSVAYSASGAAKITVLCDTDTGEKDADGTAILQRSRSTWYLSEAGEISESVPDRRAAGEWLTINVKGSDDVFAKVVEAFAKNQTSHKLEFLSSLDLSVQDECTFLVYGELLHSHISYKRKTSEDKRYHYKSGELATTATEKWRGVRK